MLSSATFCHNFIIVAFLITSKYIVVEEAPPPARSWGLIHPLNVLAIFSKLRRMQNTDDFSRKTIFLLSSVLLGSLLVFSPAQSLLQGKAHIDHISEQMQRNCCIYKEYNANARLQMKYMTTNYRDLSLCLCKVFVFAFVFVSQQYSSRRRPASQALGGFVVRLSSPAISYMHCSAPAQRIIYIWNICSIFFVQQYLVLLLHCPWPLP